MPTSFDYDILLMHNIKFIFKCQENNERWYSAKLLFDNFRFQINFFLKGLY